MREGEIVSDLDRGRAVVALCALAAEAWSAEDAHAVERAERYAAAAFALLGEGTFLDGEVTRRPR